jgi:hypothetical protein
VVLAALQTHGVASALFVNEANHLYSLLVMGTTLKFIDQIGYLGDLTLSPLNLLVIIAD